MGYTQLLGTTSPTKPPSELKAKGVNILLNTLRNEFTISTWLSLGAILQTALLMLPIRPYLAAGPAVILILWRVMDGALMTWGWKKNYYMEGLIHEKYSALYPSAHSDEKGPPASEEVCVLLLAAKSNSPLGMFDSADRELGAYFDVMAKDLERNAAEWGWLGANSWSKSSDRTSKPEVLVIHYFKSMDHLHKFAHSKTHRDGWDWWNRNAKNMKHIGISHEAFSVPKARWETIYINYKPEGFAGTTHPVKQEDGSVRWVSPVVSAARGRLRTSAGRVGLGSDVDGSGNEKYGPDPYEDY